MIPTSTREIARIVGGEHLGQERTVSSVSIHSGEVTQGGLFVALAGERADGHDFVGEVLAQPQCAALVSREGEFAGTHIRVHDCTAALAKLARWHYARIVPKTLAITGSAGKTTTRQCAHAIVQRTGSAIASEKNYNNHLGVPLTLLRLQEQTRALVLEVGASAAGEIAALMGMVRCEVCILTNAMEAHLQGFGSLQGVARAKGEIIDAVVPDGTAVLNREDRFYDEWRARAGARRVLSFGFAASADVRAQQLRRLALAEQAFVLDTPWGSREVQLALPGRHNVANALAAAAAALALGADLDQVAAGLHDMRAVAGRSRLLSASGGVHLLDDCYNANPGSVRAAIDVLAQHAEGRRWLVLGEMGELGEDSARLHCATGLYAAKAGLSGIAAMGGYAAEVVRGYGCGAVQVDSHEDALQWLRERTGAGDLVVVKGSRSMGMEAIVSALVSES